jgi:hypothetical protein
MKIYVGYKEKLEMEIFKSQEEPTANKFPQYLAVIGPFKTMRGAKFMRDYGRSNPHVQNVYDAERLAKSKLRSKI